MITEITKEVEQLKILNHIVDLKPITKASMNKIKSLADNGDLGLDEFEEILKIGIGEEAFKLVFPDDDSLDIEVMIKAALTVYEKFLDKNIEAINQFSNKYSPNRAARRASNKK